MNLNKTTVLVTGAGGFIGSHLVEALLQHKCHIRALVHYNSRNCIGHLSDIHSPRLTIVPGDIRDLGLMETVVKGCDLVFHLAALIAIPYSYQAPASFIETNVKGTLNILEAARRHRIRRLIHTSTSEVYGTAEKIPMDEFHVLKPQSPYAASKLSADMLALSYWRTFGVPVTVLRPFNTFGPRQSLRAIIPTVLTQIAFSHGPLRLGRLDPVRDFNYVTDTVEAFILAALSNTTAGKVINVGTGVGRSVRQVIDDSYALIGRKHPNVKIERQRLRPVKSEVLKLICDSRRAKEVLGWTPRTSFKDGLKATLNYIKKNIDPGEVNNYVI